ncbi:hypothetical protein EfmAA242_31880 (plasmid) [Enterococcus faecium]|nr:hypothetical protein EfmAA242_31880 [Enterococcus faecium]
MSLVKELSIKDGPNISNIFYSELIEYLEIELFTAKAETIICNSQNDPAKEREYIEMLEANQVDGIISSSHNLGIADYERVRGSKAGIQYATDFGTIRECSIDTKETTLNSLSISKSSYLNMDIKRLFAIVKMILLKRENTLKCLKPTKLMA